MEKRGWTRAAAVLSGMLLLAAGASNATTLASSTLQVATPSGTIVLASQVDDEFQGDPSRWTFAYALSGNYEPIPGSTNGISSLQLIFGDLVDIDDQSAPAGWVLNDSGLAPPFGAGFDISNASGSGAGPGSGATFSFSVPAGTGFTDEPQGSDAASHYLDTPFGLVALVDDASGRGPLVPVPEPASAALLAGGAALLARARFARAPRRSYSPRPCSPCG